MSEFELSGMLASAVVAVALDKLAAALGDAAVAAMPENMRRQLEELKGKMESVAGVLGDAERRSGREGEQAVREWLIRLEDVAYGIWDMVDDLLLLANNGAPVMPVHSPCLPITTARRWTMASWMTKAKESLDSLQQQQIQRFGFIRRGDNNQILEQSVTGVVRPGATSFVDECSFIVGMDKDKHKIMDFLHDAATDNSRGLVTLAILGMGGTGKTALARMVFSDATVIRDYARAWVKVGVNFDLKVIGNCILSQLSKGEHEDLSDVELIMKRLHKLHVGGGNKVLVVLNDLCSGSSTDLQDLKLMLGAWKKGPKLIVIVTTSSYQVAAQLGNRVVYKTSLPVELESLQLLQQKPGFAFRPDNARLELKQILRIIAYKCRGIPVAIHALGYMLQSKSMEEIKSVINSDIWKDSDDGLLLSFRCMPPDLRLCLAYCATFPRGHIILKDDIIHHWIAPQLIQPSDGLSAKQLANKYIEMLLGMSFLRPMTPSSDDRSAVSFTMHDLVYDLALEVSSGKSIVLDSINSYQLHFSQEKSYRQAWLTNFDGLSPQHLSGVLSAQLRALLFHGCNTQLSDDSFSSAKYMRVLDLRDSSLQKLPDSICQLRQLRYLNLSGSSNLLKLPDSFGDLLNLGHIDLSGCFGLLELTASFGNLINARHIDLSGCSGLLELPASFGNLTNAVHIDLSGCVGLKTLPMESFGLLEKLEHLDFSSCSCFEGIPSALVQLTNLQHLNLSHPCCYLAEYRFHLEALKDVWVNLMSLRYLNLSMCLNPIFCYQKEEERTKHIESLSCLHMLEHLDLSNNIFLLDIPESLDKLSQLQTLNLSGCIRLKKIDKWLREITKFLSVSNCLSLERYQFVVRTDGGADSSNLAQLKDVSCKEVEISCLEKVISTVEAQSIRLIEKKKLCKLKLVWSVARDDVSDVSLMDEALLAELVPPHNLQCFELHGYSSKYFPAWLTLNLFSHLPNLVEITMADIASCSNLPPLGVLPNLQRLVLRRVAKVTRIDASHLSGGSDAAFHRLVHVTLDCMISLEEIVFHTLDELVVTSCPNLRLGDSHSSPKARILVLSDCEEVVISCLEKVKSKEEAQSIRLIEKKKLQKLTLVWGAICDDASLKDETLLAELVPPHNLQHFELHGYHSEYLPAWLTLSIVSHLPNLVTITMADIPICSNLPPLGVLPKLQRLVLRRMVKVTKINAGHLSGGSKAAAFPQLVHVTLDGMVGLEEIVFTTLSLDELVIKSCPRLRFRDSPPKARMLVISDCVQLMVSPSPENRGERDAVEDPSTSTCTTSAPVTKVVIESCNVTLDELKWSLLEGLAPLHSLQIKDCSEKIISAEIMQGRLLSSLQLLCFSYCNSMAYLPEHVVQDTSPQELLIYECHGIKSLPRRICEKNKGHYPLLRIRDCPELRKWCESNENKRNLAHIQLIFEESGTSEAERIADAQCQIERMLSFAATTK